MNKAPWEASKGHSVLPLEVGQQILPFTAMPKWIHDTGSSCGRLEGNAVSWRPLQTNPGAMIDIWHKGTHERVIPSTLGGGYQGPENRLLEPDPQHPAPSSCYLHCHLLNISSSGGPVLSGRSSAEALPADLHSVPPPAQGSCWEALGSRHLIG